MDHAQDDQEEEPIVFKGKIKGPADIQRIKLERLMKNPDKPVVIPERPKGKTAFAVPEFVRNVTGSSAGAGSGEFHVYRHLRRKEYARQKFIDQRSETERMDDEFREKLEENRRVAEERTAKKRAKRLKKKANRKNNKRRKDENSQKKQDESKDDESNSESEESDASDTKKDELAEVSNAGIAQTVQCDETKSDATNESKDETSEKTLKLDTADKEIADKIE